MHDRPADIGECVPSPTLVAAWLRLGTLPTERVPRWAACWLAAGYDAAALRELAGLHGDDPHEIRDLLPDALDTCDVTIPGADIAAVMDAFTDLAYRYLHGTVGERWVVDKVTEIVSGFVDPASVIAVPLGYVQGLRDDGNDEGHLRAAVRRACENQLHLATTK